MNWLEFILGVVSVLAICDLIHYGIGSIKAVRLAYYETRKLELQSRITDQGQNQS